MARELVWLESFSFTAWGCKECNWLIPGVRHTDSGKPPARVQEAFDRHECAKFPRQPSGGKRNKSSSLCLTGTYRPDTRIVGEKSPLRSKCPRQGFWVKWPGFVNHRRTIKNTSHPG